MSRTHSIVALATVVALSGVGLTAAGQQGRGGRDGTTPTPDARPGPQRGPGRTSDRQIERLLAQMRTDTGRFGISLDQSLRRLQIDESRPEDNIRQFLAEFTDTANHLGDHVTRRQAVAVDVEDVLRRGVRIDSFMQRHRLSAQAENDWLALRRDMESVAGAYDVAWNWSNPRYTADSNRPDIYRRLTGTYQLDRARGDDAARAVQQATRTLPPNQRQAAYDRLMERLDSPDRIVIDRNQNAVTLASSRGPRMTFEADGQLRTERGDDGGRLDTRAALYGDQLVITATSVDRVGDDFSVTFEPIDGGAGLLVTRRLYGGTERQDVTVENFYQRSSAQAQWDVYSPESDRNPRVRGRAGEARGTAGVPDGVRLMGGLDNALSTSNANEGDRFTVTVTSPGDYAGAVISGLVSSVNGSGRVRGRAEMILDFDRIRMRDGREYQFAGILETVHTPDGDTVRVSQEGTVEDSSQGTKTAQRAGIGAGIGAIIGAITGGGSGAAIGAAIGAGGGAGTVLIEGRDQLELARGSVMTIRSRSY